MAYGWGTNEPVIKPIEEGGDNINQYALKIKDALDALYVELRQDIVRATLAEAIAGTDIKKIVTPSTAFRTYYGESEPSNLQGKNGDTYIRYGNTKDTYIKASGSWQKIDAVPQPATFEEVDAGSVSTKYVTPDSLYNSRYSQLNENGLLPWHFLPSRIMVWDTPGEYEWTVPENVSTILVSGCGGGGGGGGGTRSYGYRQNGGYGGTAGTQVINFPIAVEAGRTYIIVVGAGGTRGYHTGKGGNGGATSIEGASLSLGGGNGGAGGASEYGTGENTHPLNGKAGNGGSTFWGTGGVWSALGYGQAGQGYGSGGSGGFNGSDYCYGSAGAPGLLMVIF